MHTRFLDVFHNPADDHVGTVSQRVHIDFRSFFQKLIDQHGTRRPHHGRLRHIFLHGVHVIRDDHRTSAQHVTWPYENWQPNFSGHARRFFRYERGTVARLRNF